MYSPPNKLRHSIQQAIQIFKKNHETELNTTELREGRDPPLMRGRISTL